MIQTSTQRHIDQTQLLSGSLKTFLVTVPESTAWDTADHTQDTIRNISQGVQAVANLVMLGSANDATASGGGTAQGIRIATENHGESAENIQKAVRTATGHATATVADFKF